MVSHVLASGVNGHAIGRRVDARGEHERTVVDKHLGRRDIANNAYVTDSATSFIFTTSTPVVEIAFTMIPVRSGVLTNAGLLDQERPSLCNLLDRVLAMVFAVVLDER